MTIQVHDEGGFQGAAVFLENWLPMAVNGLTDILGQPRQSEDTHIVLSSTIAHRTRFPRRELELESLLGEGFFDPSPTSLADLFHSEAYAHGATTICDRRQNPPTAIPVGAPVIYLDIPTIAGLAIKNRVSEEAMLGRVTVHELSHAFRGHGSTEGRTTHGYVREGDAQRDTWQFLADLLAVPEWENLAREARTAQKRLSATQPPAYAQFGQSSPDRWNREDPPDQTNWALAPIRRLLPLSRSVVIEVPICVSGRLGVPAFGDHVYLHGDGLLAGPWVVVGRPKTPYVLHARDRIAIAADKVTDGNSRHEWLHLRAQRDMGACIDPDPRLMIGPKMKCRKIEGINRELLRATVTGDFEAVLAAAAERDRRAYLTSANDLVASCAAKGVSISSSVVDSYDPYTDD